RNLADDSKRLLAFFKYAPWVTLVLVVGTGGTAYAILALSQNLDPVLFARNANAANALVLASLLLLASVGLILARRLSFFDSRAWQWAALALLFFDLFSLGAYVDLGLSDPTAPFQHDDVAQFLRTDRSVFRIDSRTDVRDVWASDTALRYGLQDTTGDNPLVLGRFNTFWEALGSRSSSLYDLLNVKYVIAHRSTPLDAKFVPAFDGSGDIRVYENKTALPRAFIVSASSRAATPEEALALIHAPAFDPTKSVVLEGGPAHEFTPGDSTGNSVTITKYSLNEITMQVESVREGYVVLGDVYYPGWRAFIDGTGSEILRADYLFRAIPIPAGSHAVRFIYQPLTLYLGAAVSALTIVGLVGWLVWKRRGGKK
ncbi:MAG TPA: YfhO family protein, partial [Anaerolineae bacterium]